MTDPMVSYHFFAVVGLALIFAVWFVLLSPLGRLFRALRENEDRARYLGYTVTRLKHEELNQADVAPPSYEMVAMPEKTNDLPSAQTEPAVARPEAAVKGITPSQPAPIVDHTPKAVAAPAAAPGAPSIISKIFGWFNKRPATTAVETKPAMTRDRPERTDRGERPGQRRGRQNGPRRDHKRDEPRGDRPAQEPRNEGSAEGGREGGRNQQRGRNGEPRPPREPREPRPPRDPQQEQQRRDRQQQQRPPRPEGSDQPQAEAGGTPGQPREQQAPRAEGEGRGEGRSRRRRGGRGGRDRAERHDTQTAAEGAPQQQVAATGNGGAEVSAEAMVADSQVTADSFPTRQVEVPRVPTPPAPVETSYSAPLETSYAAPVREAEPEHRAQPEPVAERVVEHVPAAPVVVAPAVPVVRAPVVLPPDLSQVETNSEKLNVAASKVEPSAPPRPPRVRPPLPPVSSEPLAQVETRK